MVQLRPIGPVRIAATLAAAIAVMSADGALAQSKLDATYSITAARIPIGSLAASLVIGDDQYAMTMTGRASGAARIISAGEGQFSVRGALKDGKPSPVEYSAKTTSDDDTLDVKMTFADGSVKELSASAPPPASDRVPLTEANRQNVIDPLTALVITGPETGDVVAAPVCQRTLPVFDGRRRFDLKLAFKRLDKVKAEKGFAGPVVVCSLALQPIAGHRTSTPLLKFLAEGREMEMSFAPIKGTRLLAPFQISIISMLGNLVISATRFEVTAPPLPAAATPVP